MTMKYLHCYDHRNITQLLLAKKKKKGNGYITQWIMQVAQSDRRRQQNDKKSTNETISIITEWKDLNKWTQNTQREKEKKRKTTRKKNT